MTHHPDPDPGPLGQDQPGREQAYGQQGYGQPGYGQAGYGQAGPQAGAGQYGAPAYGTPAPYGGFGAPPAPKPGVVPLRPLGLAEILDGTITTMRRYPRPTFALSAAVAVVTGLFALLQNVTLVSDTTAAFATSVGASVVGGIVSYVTTVLLAGGLSLVLSEGMLGRQVTAGQVWARLRPRVPGLVGLALLSGLLVLLGLVAFLIGALVVGIFLLLAAPAYVLENASVTGALRRSAGLVRGSWWRVFGIYLLMSILVGIVGLVPLVPVGLAVGFDALDGTGTGLGIGTYLLIVLLISLVSLLTAPVTAYVVGLLYVDQRMRREGLDLQLAQAAGVAPAYGQAQYGQAQYGQPQHGQPPYVQPTYGEPGAAQGGWTPGGDGATGGGSWSSPPS